MRCLAYSPDTRLLASGGDDGQVRIWDLQSGQPLLPACEPHKDWVQALTFSPDGQYLISASWDGNVRRWQINTRGRQRTYEAMISGQNPGFWSLALDPHGHSLAAGALNGSISLCWLRDRSRIRSWKAHEAPVRALGFTPDGKSLLSAGHDRTIRLWDSDWGTEQALLGSHNDWICGMALSPDGQLLASAGHDGQIRLWDMAQRREQAVLSGHTKRICQVGFSRDGRSLLSVSWDMTVRIWDVQRHCPRSIHDFRIGPIHCVALAPDGMTAAAGGRDSIIVVWDIDDLDW